MKTIIIALLMMSTNAFADNELLKVHYGVGIGGDEQIINSADKSISLGYYTDVEKSLSYNIQVGFMHDGEIETQSWYGCAQFGSKIKPFSGFYIENYFGPCKLNTPDNVKLTGQLQFQTHLGIGFRDPVTSNEIGFNWKHFSNAGIKKPNVGRDYIMFSLGFGI